MRYLEIMLLEYNRLKTEQQLSSSIINAARKDGFLKNQNLDEPQTVKAVIDRAEETDPSNIPKPSAER